MTPVHVPGDPETTSPNPVLGDGPEEALPNMPLVCNTEGCRDQAWHAIAIDLDQLTGAVTYGYYCDDCAGTILQPSIDERATNQSKPEPPKDGPYKIGADVHFPDGGVIHIQTRRERDLANAAYAAHSAADSSTGQWEPIETAPKDGRWIILAAKNQIVCRAKWQLWEDGSGGYWFGDLGAGVCSAPLGWMPYSLPEPPTTETGETNG